MIYLISILIVELVVIFIVNRKTNNNLVEIGKQMDRWCETMNNNLIDVETAVININR